MRLAGTSKMQAWSEGYAGGALAKFNARLPPEADGAASSALRHPEAVGAATGMLPAL
jgi:hypothetical protein